MRISLLGELEVLDDDGTPVVVTGTKQRALLAVLALHGGRVVATDQLVEALWGEQPPPAVRNGLQGLVSKLRRALGAPELVVMRGGGYALDVAPDAVDVHRYEELVGRGRAAASAGDPAGASVLLAAADSLWQGDALVEFVYEQFAIATIARLTELRLATIEERLDAELQLGHPGTVGELESIVAAHPLRERPRGLLMLALYRAGRQAEALRLYQDGRHLLSEELGLDPGPELRRLQAAILAQDPSLDAPGGAGAAGEVATGHRPTIPASLTELVGRDEELGDLMRLADDHRFITLVGPGGVGKTRLALEVARSRAPGLAHGACLVELAPVGDPVAVRAAITAALGLPDPTRLAAMIGDREVLIVLDNCEHVIATAAEVAEDLLRHCPRLRLLATSREGLRVGGETIWPVPPLPADDAVRLFLARASAAGARVDPSAEMLVTVADICARLDGLPLAIELAAARARAFPVPQIRSRLNDRFRLLTGGSRTALPRQQTLRAVVDWSYDLLFDDEQRVFERLSVFAGGCDLATAQAVCVDDRLDGADVEDIVHALVDKSLVNAVPGGDELRFVQLQTLAQYGREKLAERGDAARTRDAMAAHFARLCASSAAAFIGDQQRSWLTTIAQEQDNLRAALEWAVATADAETALTIAGGASWPHWLAGTAVEAKRWLDEAFACDGAASEIARALAMTGRGLIEFQLGMAERVDADLAGALTVFRDHGDVASQALTYSFYAEVAATRGDADDGRRRRLEVLAFYTALPDEPFVMAARRYSEGKLGLLDGDLPRAEDAYRAAADGFAQPDRPMMRAMCLGMVADFDERAGDHRAAIKALEEAVDINDALGLRGFMGALLVRLGWALLHDGDTTRAELKYRRALDLARDLGNGPAEFLALAGLALLDRLQGRDGQARDAAVHALDQYLLGGPRRLANRVDPRADVLIAAAVCCDVLGAIAADEGLVEHAAELLGHADELHREAGAPVPAFQRADVARAREAAVAGLGRAAFDAAFERGRRGHLGHELDVRG